MVVFISDIFPKLSFPIAVSLITLLLIQEAEFVAIAQALLLLPTMLLPITMRHMAVELNAIIQVILLLPTILFRQTEPA